MIRCTMKEYGLARFRDFVSKNWRFPGTAIGATCILVMTLLMTVDVLGRFLGMPTGVAHELSGYMLVAIVLLGLAHTQRKGKHIKIILLTNRLSQRKRRQLEIVTLTLASVCVGVLTWYTSSPFIENYVAKNTSVTQLHTPLWIPYSLVPLGLGMLAIELIFATIKTIRFR